MYQGETITTTIYGFPVPISSISNLFIIFKNQFKTLVEKTLKDCEISGETLSFTLSQQESLQLSCGMITRHVVVITNDGSRFESCPSPFKCVQTAKNEVLA